MINFKDAIPPAGKGNVRVINGVEQTVVYPAGWENGTALNRANLMALQGMESASITFAEDGSIIENYTGGTLTTVFNADGSITETFAAGSQTLSKRTTFNADGSITEEMI